MIQTPRRPARRASVVVVLGLLTAVIAALATPASAAPVDSVASYAAQVRSATTAHPVTIGTFVADDGQVVTLDTNTVRGLRFDSGVMSPQYHTSWGWISGTIYFNKRETQLMASSGYVAWFAAFLPPPFDVIVGGSAVFISAMAASAVYWNQCLAVKSYGTPYRYSGSWCS